MPAFEFSGIVTQNRFITPTVFLLEFQTSQPLTFAPGQFASMNIPGAGPNGRDLKRAYSIASNPEYGKIELCIQVVEKGPGTSYLKKLQVNDPVKCIAPYGTFIYKPRTEPSHAFFIATGTGISPFRSMIHSELFKTSPPKSLRCIFGTRTEADILFEKEFRSARLKNGDPIDYTICLSKSDAQWSGYKGRVTDYLRMLPTDFPWQGTDFYMCGNGAMIKEVKTLLAEKGVPKDWIHQEVYYSPKAGEDPDFSTTPSAT